MKKFFKHSFFSTILLSLLESSLPLIPGECSFSRSLFLSPIAFSNVISCFCCCWVAAKSRPTLQPHGLQHARLLPLFSTISESLLKFMSIESVMLSLASSNHQPTGCVSTVISLYFPETLSNADPRTAQASCNQAQAAAWAPKDIVIEQHTCHDPPDPMF